MVGGEMPGATMIGARLKAVGDGRVMVEMDEMDKLEMDETKQMETRCPRCPR